MMHRRSFLGLGLGVVGLACSSHTSGAGDERGASPPSPEPPSPQDPAPAAAEPPPSPFAFRQDVPGYVDCGPWQGEGPAPVFVQLRLNINDFMRPEREAAAVHRWLDLERELQVGPSELSFTGHVLQAFIEHDPALIERVRDLQPAIYQHYRILKSRRLMTTERELVYTVPETMELDPSRAGPCLLIQQTFGVTPCDNGGALAELFRSRWVESEAQQEYERLGFDQLERRAQIGHPDRIVAMSLPDPGPVDGHEQVEAYLQIHRLVEDLNSGSTAAPTPTMLYRMCQLAWEMGFALTDIPGLSTALDPRGLPDFGMGMAKMEPRHGELAGLSTDDRLALGRALAERIASLPTIEAELRSKLSHLQPDRVYATRLAWHASNEYTVEPWGMYMWGERGTYPHPMQPAHTRPQAQVEALIAALRSIFSVVADNPRTRTASLLRETQWLPDNAAGPAWQALFGSSMQAQPGAVSAERIEAEARSRGIEIPDPTGGKGRGPRGKAGGWRGGPGRRR